jgi:hypothetical protein
MEETKVLDELFDAKFNALHNEIEALRLLKAHDLASMQSRIDALKESRELDLHSLSQKFNNQIIAAREYTDLQNANIREALIVALAASSAAIGKSDAATEKRFDQVNEFRGSLSDLSNRMIQRTEVDALIKGYTEKSDSITSRMDRLQGTQRGSETSWSTMLAVAAVIVSLGVGIMSFTNGHGTDTAAVLAAQNARMDSLSQRLLLQSLPAK